MYNQRKGTEVRHWLPFKKQCWWCVMETINVSFKTSRPF